MLNGAVWGDASCAGKAEILQQRREVPHFVQMQRSDLLRQQSRRSGWLISQEMTAGK